MNILFVCTGNTCRSPMAESIAAHLLKDREDIHIESAGFTACYGDRIADQSQQVLKEEGIAVKTPDSSRFNQQLGQWADIIYVMTEQHYDYMKMRFPEFIDKTKLLGDGIPDPFSKGIEQYRNCFQIIKQSIKNELKLGGGLSC